jgi:MFS-type transporter involved in bile tolerance (Atg22 family)
MMHTGPAKDVQAAGKRTRLAWYAYDLGNTSVEFAIPLYLTIWIVTDLGVAAWVFGLASALSSWAIGLSGPYIGVHADETQSRRSWFTTSVISSAVLLASLSFLPTTGTPALVAILVVAMASNYLFQLSSLIYNASMLRAAGKANVVSVSSLGLGLSFLGGAVGVGIIQLVVSGHLIPGVSGRGYALVPAALIFIACAIPSFLNDGLWQSRSEAVSIPEGGLHRRITELWRESSREYRPGWFLAGYFALNSSMMGLTLYLPLHIQHVTDLEGTGLLLAFGIVVLTSAAGAGFVAFLRPTGRMVRRIVLVGLTLLAINAFVFSVVSLLPLVVICACLHGFFSGALAPTVRAAFAQAFAADYQALAFGLFGAVQRVSQGLGAVLWPIAGMIGEEKAAAWGIVAMGVLALVGVPLFAQSRLGSSTPAEGAAQNAAAAS